MLSNKSPTLVGKGTYGCVFYPSMNICNGKIEDDIDNEHYITKIQKYSVITTDEVKISALIKTIPLYNIYFAPVIKSCKINTTNMDYNLVRTCAEVHNDFGELDTTSSFISNKIRYVGKNTTISYIKTLKHTPRKLYRKMINTHIHILSALQLLYEKHIIHFDIKPQNIMYDDIQDIPIIVDFGISRNIKPLLSPRFNPINNESIMQKTFISYDTYDYWCIDIYILSNIDPTSPLKLTGNVTGFQINNILRGFFSPIFMALFSDEEVLQFKRRLISYFSQYKNKPWTDVFHDLMKHYETWDNYSTAITYLYTYYTCKPSKVHDELIQQYLTLLKNIVISMPDTRPTAKDTRETIMTMFSLTIV